MHYSCHNATRYLIAVPRYWAQYLGGTVPTYRLRKVRRRLEEMGAIFTDQAGRKHGTVKYRGRVARWPNQHDDPISDPLLSDMLRQLGIPRSEYFKRNK